FGLQETATEWAGALCTRPVPFVKTMPHRKWLRGTREIRLQDQWSSNQPLPPKATCESYQGARRRAARNRVAGLHPLVHSSAGGTSHTHRGVPQAPFLPAPHG